jgi:hypothetical protein
LKVDYNLKLYETVNSLKLVWFFYFYRKSRVQSFSDILQGKINVFRFEEEGFSSNVHLIGEWKKILFISLMARSHITNK